MADRKLHWRQKRLVGRTLFQVRAARLRQGDYINALAETVRCVEPQANGTVEVSTNRRIHYWSPRKKVKVYHGRWT